MTIMIQPSADVASDAVIGEDTKVWHLVRIRPGVRFGRECVFGRGVYVDHG